MTDLRAKRLAIQWSQGFLATISEKEARSYHKKMLELLREREERSKGCSICDGINSPNTLDGFMRMGYKYCPVCGRKLKQAMPGEDKHHGS